MGKITKVTISHCHVLIFIMVLLPALCISTGDYEPTKATYYGSPYSIGFPLGACGYGLYGKTVNDGNVVAVSKLLKDGSGCGACYHVKCKAPECSEEGLEVVATDHGFGHDADFIFSPKVFVRMAEPGKEKELLSSKYLDVEYKRVPCKYPGKNLVLKVHEHSHYPNYLALVPLYQAGMYDITAVEMYEEGSKQWKPRRRAYGTVWDMVSPPRGELTVRFFVCAGGQSQGRWVVASKVIPANWNAGVECDTSVQLE